MKWMRAVSKRSDRARFLWFSGMELWQTRRAKVGPFRNLFDGVQIRSEYCLKCQIYNHLGTERAFEKDEGVYLLKVELKGDSIGFEVQSCGACDPNAVDPTYRPIWRR